MHKNPNSIGIVKLDMAKKLLINNLLLGITGSVGVLVVPDYIKLRENIAENVYVMMSYSAQKFITPYTLQLYSAKPAFHAAMDAESTIPTKLDGSVDDAT